jgi:hypothetical protein
VAERCKKKLTSDAPRATVAPVWFGTTRMYHPVSEENLKTPTPQFRVAWGTFFLISLRFVLPAHFCVTSEFISCGQLT